MPAQPLTALMPLRADPDMRSAHAAGRSFQFSDDVVCIHAYDELCDSCCVAGTAADKLYGSDDAVFNFYVDGLRTGAFCFIYHGFFLLLRQHLFEADKWACLLMKNSIAEGGRFYQSVFWDVPKRVCCMKNLL